MFWSVKAIGGYCLRVPWLVELAPTIIGVLLLIAVASVIAWRFHVPEPWAAALAVLRGAAQLAAVSLVLAGIIGDPRWVAVALGVMFVAAAATSAARTGFSWRRLAQVGGALAMGVGVTLLIVFGSGAIEPSSRYVLAVGGIVIGNAMSISTLTAQRFSDAVVDRWPEVEGWLALGATPRQSTIELARRAVHTALVPSIDQTKTTGLVVLPGAFVGAIFGGASPLEAGRFQIVVLASILCAGTVVAVALVAALGSIGQKPGGPL